MHISFFNTYQVGGAAKAALNLFNKLQDPLTGTFVYKAETPHEPCKKRPLEKGFYQLNRCTEKSIPQSLRSRLYHHTTKGIFKSKPQGFEQFSLANQPDRATISDLPFQPDLIHLHWIADWFNIPTFFSSIPDHIPIVWTLHDMNPFTGGCHFANNCRLYTSDCAPCAQLNKEAALYGAKNNLISKANAYSHKNITIVSPSHWLTKCAKESILFQSLKHQTIPNGVDNLVFSPRDSASTIKNKYNIPTNKTCVLFLAQSTTNKRKGWKYLEQLMVKLPADEFVFFVVGEGHTIKQANVINTGFLSNAVELAEIYAMADIYLTPALEDNLPNTVLEAMACGTPVVAFNIGGIPDMVVHGKHGFLAEKENVDQLILLIKELSNNRILLKQMGENARQQIVSNFTLELQAKRYAELYNQLS